MDVDEFGEPIKDESAADKVKYDGKKTVILLGGVDVL